MKVLLDFIFDNCLTR